MLHLVCLRSSLHSLSFDLDSLAGHCLFGCDGSRHLKHCASVVFSVPFLGLRDFFASFSLVLTYFPFSLDKRSTLAGVCSDLFPCMKVCCFFTVSDCLALVTAFSKVSLRSSCSCSKSFLSLNLQRFCLGWDHLSMFQIHSIQLDNINLLWSYPRTLYPVDFSS